MARERKPDRERNPARLRHVNALAVRVARAMSHDFLVVVQVAGRGPRKLTGRIRQRRVRAGWTAQNVDGETGLEFLIVGEGEVAEWVRLERVQSIERKRLAPEAP